MQTLGNKCQIFILLKGLIDVPREIARIKEKLQKLEGQIAKLVASMSIEGYEEKVSALYCEADTIRQRLSLVSSIGHGNIYLDWDAKT